KRGTEGFGFDPIFIPRGESRTFAEMSLEEKNRYSHRARAVKKMLDFLLEFKF
ncbi:MAG: non-canonical purine NTP pyrophosphatase, partial [Thermoprotei archaeon]